MSSWCILFLIWWLGGKSQKSSLSGRGGSLFWTPQERGGPEYFTLLLMEIAPTLPLLKMNAPQHIGLEFFDKTCLSKPCAVIHSWSFQNYSIRKRGTYANEAKCKQCASLVQNSYKICYLKFVIGTDSENYGLVLVYGWGDGGGGGGGGGGGEGGKCVSALVIFPSCSREQVFENEPSPKASSARDHFLWTFLWPIWLL